jgi:hypothetical protein
MNDDIITNHTRQKVTPKNSKKEKKDKKFGKRQSWHKKLPKQKKNLIELGYLTAIEINIIGSIIENKG